MRVVDILLSLFACLTLIEGFKDTSPFFISEAVNVKLPYVTPAETLAGVVNDLVEKNCARHRKVIIYRVNNLQREKPGTLGTFLKHVHYGSSKELELEQNFAKEIPVKYFPNEVSEGHDNMQVFIVDVEDENAHFVEEFYRKHRSELIIVQGKPSFTDPTLYHNDQEESTIHAGKGKTEGFNNLRLRNTQETRDEHLTSQDDVEQEFREVYSLLSEAEDITVTALDPGEKPSSRPSPQTTERAKNSLFDKYTYFSTGVWMGLIVSGFLIWVLALALSWITNLEVSYKSFEKPVDFEKKTQ